MQIRITGRHFGLTEDIREVIQKRIEKLENFYNRILEAHIVLDLEDNRYLSEITLKTHRAQFHAEDEEYDLFASINATMDKVERQIKRRKDKVKDSRHNVAHREVVWKLGGYDEKSEAMKELDREEQSQPAVIKVYGQFASKPISLQEAAMELELSDDDLLMFMNSETNQVNLLYILDDGNYGWVEPEFA